MKKIIALALALTLALSMASVAFAAVNEVDKGALDGLETVYRPGTTIESDEFANYGDWTISAKWTKGAALVEKVYIDKDSDMIFIDIKENYTISVAKDLEGVITIKGKSNVADTKDQVYTYTVSTTVTNKLEPVYGSKKVDDAFIVESADDDTIYQCEEDEAGYVKFSTDSDLLGVTLKMASEEKAFMFIKENDGDIMDELEEKFPDADLQTYTFGGAPSFKNAADLTLQGDYSDQYVIYAYEGKKLTKVDAEWNNEDGVYEWSTKTPRTYVISDVELVAADEETEEDDKNPDTGANDVVGVAAALAVVSLVAAGAVSLKK